MKDNQFICEVAEEVLRRLENQIEQKVLLKKRLYLVGAAELDLLYELEKRYFIITGEDRNNKNYFKNEAELVDNLDAVLVTELAVNSLTNLALLTYQNFDEKIILTSLLAGKQVTFISEGMQFKKYKHSCNKALYQRYLEYEEKLKNYGIRMIEKQSFTPSLLEKHQFSKFSEKHYQYGVFNQDTIDLSHQHLILEKDVMSLRYQTNVSLLVKNDCIITPIAQDIIRENRINIIRKSNSG